MYKVVCVVCNYNKEDFVVECVRSLKEQTLSEVHIIVVDNASKDDSVDKLREKFFDTIEIVRNKENLGGSGGFNSGLERALEYESEYIMLIDNDVFIDSAAIEIMYSYMNEHEDVGILGPTVRMMKDKKIVQDFGGKILDNYTMLGNYFEMPDENLPEEIEADYISTCAAMARTKAVREFGILPGDNFIYWDDVEWSKKCKLAGYKTMAVNKAKVWHNFQTTKNTSFNKYYLYRNRLHYFSKYLDESKLDMFMNTMLKEIFSALFGYRIKNNSELFDAVVFAYDDFLHGVRGKAMEYKLKPIVYEKTPFEKLLCGKKSIQLFVEQGAFFTENEKKQLDIFKKKIEKLSGAVKIEVTEIAKEDSIFMGEGYDLQLLFCEHVSKVEKNILPVVYVDKYFNCISNEDEFAKYQSFEAMSDFFVEMNKPLFENAIKRIRNGE